MFQFVRCAVSARQRIKPFFFFILGVWEAGSEFHSCSYTQNVNFSANVNVANLQSVVWKV